MIFGKPCVKGDDTRMAWPSLTQMRPPKGCPVIRERAGRPLPAN